MLTMAKLTVESSACVEHMVLVAVCLLDFPNEVVPIITAQGIVGTQILAPSDWVDHAHFT
jgi:hypothetical protein